MKKEKGKMRNEKLEKLSRLRAKTLPYAKPRAEAPLARKDGERSAIFFGLFGCIYYLLRNVCADKNAIRNGKDLHKRSRFW